MEGVFPGKGAAAQVYSAPGTVLPKSWPLGRVVVVNVGLPEDRSDAKSCQYRCVACVSEADLLPFAVFFLIRYYLKAVRNYQYHGGFQTFIPHLNTKTIVILLLSFPIM